MRLLKLTTGYLNLDAITHVETRKTDAHHEAPWLSVFMGVDVAKIEEPADVARVTEAMEERVYLLYSERPKMPEPSDDIEEIASFSATYANPAVPFKIGLATAATATDLVDCSDPKPIE